MSPENMDFYPDWDFLNDPRLRELQQSLDASLSDYSGVEDLRNKCAAFRSALLEYFAQFFSEEAMDETKLRRTVEFLHKNFGILGRGGLNARRSEQDRDLSASNQVLIDRIGNRKYTALVQQYEDKTQTSDNPGSPAGNTFQDSL